MVEYPIIIARWKVYVHVNKINGKRYVGITNKKKASSRWGTNGIGYKTTRHFYSAINKYGWGNFDHIILEENLSRSEASNLQQILIEAWNLRDPNYGYNFQKGGYHGNSGVHISQEFRAKKMGANNPKSIKVICLNTGQIYQSMRIAAKANMISTSSEIGLAIKGIRQFAGRDKEGNPLMWMVYSEYAKTSKFDIETKLSGAIKKTTDVAVVCLNNQMVFNSLTQASIYSGADAGGISKVARSWFGRHSDHIRRFRGKDPNTGELLSWMYKNDYDLLSDKKRMEIMEIIRR